MDNIQKNELKDVQGVERYTAWAIHISLGFFGALVIACILLVFSVIQNYGFVTLVLLTIVISFFAFLACFVDSTVLSKNANLRPLRQKIVTVVRATRKILEDEYHLFMRDWRETLLLIQCSENLSHENTENMMIDDSSINRSGLLKIAPTTQARRKKSKVFKLIRPLLGLKKNLFRGKKRQHGSPSKPTATHEAPT